MNNNAEFFIELEGQQLRDCLSGYCSLVSINPESLSEKIINNKFKQVHSLLINSMINYYMQICYKVAAANT